MGVRLRWLNGGKRLVPSGKRSPAVEIVQDAKYPAMWRVRTPDGKLSDMVNRVRARDAAQAALRRILDTSQSRPEAPPMR